MKDWRRKVVIVLAVSTSMFVAALPAHAAEIVIVAGGGPLPDVMGTLGPMFEKATGHTVKISFKGLPEMEADLKAGIADLIINNTDVIDNLIKSGAVASNGGTVLMISKVGMAVKAGAAKPDISTPDKLKAVLLGARTVGYSQGRSGQHFVTVMQKLGVTDAIKPKAVVVQGRPVGTAVASGEAEVGVQQVAELRPVPGVDVIGELPKELQAYFPYSVGVGAKAKDAAAARAFLTFMRSAAAQDVLKRKGMDLP